MNGFLIDVPQLAYKTWSISVIDQNTGNRMLEAEKELKHDLRGYVYSKDNEHVR